MATFIEDEELEEMVRDFTQVVPRPKSEVRRRIQQYVTKCVLSIQNNKEALDRAGFIDPRY